MWKPIALASIVALAGCSSDPATQARQQQLVTVLCMQDAILQPLATAVVGATSPGASAAATSESLLIHPAVVAACAAENARPVAVIPSSPVAPAPAPSVVAAPSVTK